MISLCHKRIFWGKNKSNIRFGGGGLRGCKSTTVACTDTLGMSWYKVKLPKVSSNVFKVLESPRVKTTRVEYRSWIQYLSSKFVVLAFLCQIISKMFPITLRLHLVITWLFLDWFQLDLVLWKALDELYTSSYLRICASRVKMVKHNEKISN